MYAAQKKQSPNQMKMTLMLYQRFGPVLEAAESAVRD